LSSGDRPPTIRTNPFLAVTAGAEVRLNDRQRQEIIGISTCVRLPARMPLYRAQSPAKWLFINVEGAVKTFRDLPSGKRRIAAFLFPGDVFGLAENGRYVNSAQAITRVTLYRVPLDTLADLLRHDGELQFAFLCKAVHEVREAQQRAVIVSRRDAPGRLAMFLRALRQNMFGDSQPDAIPLPMSRSDIAEFLALSLEAVSRATGELERRGIVSFEDRHVARVLDESRLSRLAAAL
jgi:CRP-like cAMP-binding protein